MQARETRAGGKFVAAERGAFEDVHEPRTERATEHREHCYSLVDFLSPESLAALARFCQTENGTS